MAWYCEECEFTLCEGCVKNGYQKLAAPREMLPLKVKHFSHSCKLYFKGSKDREYECMFKKVKGGCLGKSRKEKRQYECDDCEVGVCEDCGERRVNDHTASCASHPEHQLVLKFYDGEGEWECGAAGDDCEGPKDEDEKST